MTIIQEIVEIYTQMRERGSSARDALEKLRNRIETLSKKDQAEVVRQVRLIETMRRTPAEANAPDQTSETTAATVAHPPDTNPVSPPNKTSRPAPELTEWDAPSRPSQPHVTTLPMTAIPPSKAVQTCPRCGKANPVNELVCSQCGMFLQASKSNFETAKLAGENQPDSTFFSDSSTLVLMVRDSSYAYKLRPQEYRHDMVLGRSNGASMKPDIDLQEHNADELGVSRLHMTIRYEKRDNSVCVTDMNSANGTFLNGQRLHPREVRVIRNGDDLRLGKLVLKVYFQHGV